MKITVEEGILDLPKDFALEIEYHHPFYSDAGSSTIPASIPASLENRRILGWPESVNRAKRIVKERMAFIECGAYRKRCRLITEAAGFDSISASLALQESEMYTEIQDRKLRDLLANRGYGMTKSTIATPYEVYKGQHRDNWYLNDVACFPVACNLDDKGNIFIINKISDDGSSLIDIARTVTINGDKIDVPAGYGISMYMYLWAMLQYTFEECGYTVKTNVFATDGRLKHLVVLNSLADSLNRYTYSDLSWSFNFSDIVPDITVGDLITWLHDKFGVIVIYDSNQVEILLFQHITAEDPDADLTDYRRGNEIISYPSPSGLKLNIETSIQSSEPAAESLEALRKRYGNCAECYELSEISGSGLFFVHTLGKYYYKAAPDAEPTLLGSATFPYMRTAYDTNEEFSPKDIYVPMIEVDGKSMPYIGDRLHKYTVGVEDTSDYQKLMICNAIFVSTTENYCGTSNSYDENGKIYSLMYEYPTPPYNGPGMVFPDRRFDPHLNLVPEGLRKQFWEAHESNLLNSSPEINVELYLPIDILISLNLYTPKLFKGTKVVIKSLSYTISDSSAVKAKAVLQLLHQYEDAITPEDIVFGTSYQWVYGTTRYIYDDNGYAVIETDGMEDYTIEDKPDYTPSYAGKIVMRRKRWLKYKYTKKVKKWWGISSSTFTGTHTYEEYFISEAS